VGYWIGAGRRRVGELLLEESEKVVVLDLGETRGTGEIPEGRGGVIHGLIRVGKKERWMGGGGRDISRKREGERGEKRRVLRRDDKGGRDCTG
jgi:hypothetical protein